MEIEQWYRGMGNQIELKDVVVMSDQNQTSKRQWSEGGILELMILTGQQRAWVQLQGVNWQQVAEGHSG